MISIILLNIFYGSFLGRSRFCYNMNYSKLLAFSPINQWGKKLGILIVKAYQGNSMSSVKRAEINLLNGLTGQGNKKPMSENVRFEENANS